MYNGICKGATDCIFVLILIGHVPIRERMSKEERKILTEVEKQKLLQKHSDCYLCQLTFQGYSRDEIQFDHIYSYADGYAQDLTNFAPVHASKTEGKRNCHKDKGRKKPTDYREELRIKSELLKIDGLKDLRPRAVESVFSISADYNSIQFNGLNLPLYNQRIDNRDNYYFFHEVEVKHIENDEQIQLRPLESKILPLIFNLKNSIQLLPSLGRLDRKENKVKIFDGQHKAVAQIIGNNRTKIPCLVFVEPDVSKLREVIYEAHTDFVQQRYKKSHMDAKLADMYRQKIESFRIRVGDPNAPYTEQDILGDKSAAQKRNFIISSIIDEIKRELNFVQDLVAQDKNEQKTKPVLWQSLERLVQMFCFTNLVDVPSDSDKNYRSTEIENICFIINEIQISSITNKWNPENPNDSNHILCRTYYYRTAFNNWHQILERALKFSLEQMLGYAVHGDLCYREAFSTNTKKRFSEIIKKLFDAPAWVIDLNQKLISGANKDSIVQELFEKEHLDYIYMTKIGTLQ